MSTPQDTAVQHLYKAHMHDLGGGFVVRWLLPGHPQQGVGPFLFFDHFGPTAIAPGQNVDVRPHPHIGLATVAYLFEGAMLHRDHLGTVQRIEPGAVNWMVAGRGIVHSERVPDDLLPRDWTSHGLQLWVALPGVHEEDAPSFHHAAASELPETTLGDVRIRVLLGRRFGFGLASPVPVYFPHGLRSRALAWRWLVGVGAGLRRARHLSRARRHFCQWRFAAIRPDGPARAGTARGRARRGQHQGGADRQRAAGWRALHLVEFRIQPTPARRAGQGRLGGRALFHHPGRRRRAHSAAVMLILFNVLQTVGYYGFASWAPTHLIAKGYDIPKSLLYTFVIAIAYPVSSLIGTTFGDRFERKWLIVVPALGVALFGLLFANAGGAGAIILFGILVTFFNNIMSYAYHAYQSELYPTRIRAQAVGFVYSFSRISAVFSGFIIADLLKTSGDVGVFTFIAAAMVGVAVVIGVMGPRSTQRRLEDIAG